MGQFIYQSIDRERERQTDSDKQTDRQNIESNEIKSMFMVKDPTSENIYTEKENILKHCQQNL